MIKMGIGFILGLIVASGALLAINATSHGDAEVRAVARKLDDGRVEVGIQQRSGDAWAQRQLPEARFLAADAEPGRWLASSSTVVGTQSDEPVAMVAGYSHCFITHEHPGDEVFWNLMRGAILQHEIRYGAEVQYLNAHDPAEQAQLIRDCIDQGVDGIVTTLAAPDALEDVIRDSLAAEIPVATINSGVNDFKDVGVARHISIDEELAGEEAGRRLNDSGVSGTALCVIHEARNVGLGERCDGFESGYAGTVERLHVDDAGVADLPAVAAMIAQRLAEGDVGAVLTLNTQIGLAAVEAVETSGSEAAVATFDQTREVLEAIVAGDILFAVDTAPFHQAYYALSSLPSLIGGWHILLGQGVEDPTVIIGQMAVKLSPRWFDHTNATEWIIVNDLMQEWSATQNNQ